MMFGQVLPFAAVLPRATGDEVGREVCRCEDRRGCELKSNAPIARTCQQSTMYMLW